MVFIGCGGWGGVDGCCVYCWVWMGVDVLMGVVFIDGCCVY